MKHLHNHNILNDARHGFRKSRSTQTQLLTTINEHAKCLNSCEQCDYILLAFSKAIDKVSHHLLLHKLAFYIVSNKSASVDQGFPSLQRTYSNCRRTIVRPSCCDIRCSQMKRTGSPSSLIKSGKEYIS